MTCYYLPAYLPTSPDSPGHYFPHFSIPKWCWIYMKLGIGDFWVISNGLFPHFFLILPPRRGGGRNPLLPPQVFPFLEFWRILANFLYVCYLALNHKKTFDRCPKFNIVKKCLWCSKKSEKWTLEISIRVKKWQIHFFLQKMHVCVPLGIFLSYNQKLRKWQFFKLVRVVIGKKLKYEKQ